MNPMSKFSLNKVCLELYAHLWCTSHLVLIHMLLVNPFRIVQSLQLATRWNHYGILWKNRELSPIKETISNYLERVEIGFQANGIADEKKCQYSSVSQETIRVYICSTPSLLSPVKPQEKTFAELQAELTKHFQPKKVIIAERFNFHWRNQAPDESITEYVAVLRT